MYLNSPAWRARPAKGSIIDHSLKPFAQATNYAKKARIASPLCSVGATVCPADRATGCWAGSSQLAFSDRWTKGMQLDPLQIQLHATSYLNQLNATTVPHGAQPFPKFGCATSPKPLRRIISSLRCCDAAPPAQDPKTRNSSGPGFVYTHPVGCMECMLLGNDP